MQAAELKHTDFKVDTITKCPTCPIFMRITYLPAQISVEGKAFSRLRLYRMLSAELEVKLREAKVIT